MGFLNEFKNPFEVSDFSGGITDDVYLQDPKTSAITDNLFIQSDGSIETRHGSVIEDEDNPQLPTGVQRVANLINYNNSDKLFYQSEVDIFYRDPSSFTTLQGPTSNSVFSSGTLTDAVSFTQWNGQIYLTNDSFPAPQKIYKDDMGAYNVRSSGLPALATSPVITPGIAGANNYIYSFHYEYTYMVEDAEFESFGAVTQVEVTNSGDPSVNNNNITSIPVISNGAVDNFDTSNIKVFIYRTLNGGQVSYKIGEVTNGTTSFVDSYSDSTIETNLTLYIDDGTLDYDPVPLSKYVHVVNNTGYYGFISDEFGDHKNLIRQSVPGIPDACPAGFEIEVEDEIRGISSVKSNPIVLCKRHVYRIESAFDQFGRGTPLPVRISDTAGIVSNGSCVQAENYLFWFGNDGVYATDGYQLIKISDNLNDTYKAIIEEQSNTNRILGRFDEKERRIYWCVQRDSGNLDNDTFFILDLRWGIKADSVFTTWTGNSFRPTSLEFFNGVLYRGDSRGYVFTHQPNNLTDPKVDTATPADEWITETIIWNYRSINFNFGSNHFRKYVTKCLITAANIGNTSIQINAINNDGQKTRALKIIRYRRNFVWGDPDFVWGNEDCIWNSTGLIQQWRRMPAKGLRISTIQIEITNGFSIITNSDTIGTATIDPVLNTITIDDVDQMWPAESIDYYIKVETDDYDKQYLVTNIDMTGKILTLADPENTLPLGSLKWELQGYKKGELLRLLSYNLHWENDSQTQDTYESGQDGANA